MRFSRRNRHNAQRKERSQAELEGSAAGIVASEERDALLASTGEGDVDVTDADFDGATQGDPTQILLTILGRFQRQLARAQTGTEQDLWCDESMNQLILAVEVAIAQGWSDAVEALTDMGRVLQTYESAGRAQDCVSFLNDGYEILCLMVGDLMVDNVRSGVRDKWRDHYQAALEDLEKAGLTLVQDEEHSALGRDGTEQDETAQEPVSTVSTVEEDAPFDLPSEDAVEPDTVATDELPTLDELPPLEPPPLEEMLEMEREGDGAEGEDGASDDAIADEGGEVDETAAPSDNVTCRPPDEDEREEGLAPATTKGTASVAPNQIVVEILDRICDQLSNLADASDDERSISVERLESGVKALEREANKGGHEEAGALCGSMGQVCKLVAQREDRLNERFFDLAYAFCGVYMEALTEGATGNVVRWNDECGALTEFWRAEDLLVTEEADAAREQVAELVVESSALDADDLPFDDPEEMDFAELVEPASEQAQPSDSAAEARDEGTTGGRPSSQELLGAAQRAAAEGDASGAKYLALQAAGSIAQTEVANADRAVRDAEVRLKEGLEATERARAEVQEAEGSVTAAAAAATDAESQLAKAQESTTEKARNLESTEDVVAALEQQIRELQAKRDAGTEKVEAACVSLEAAKSGEEDSRQRLDETKSQEELGRIQLETCRQSVKDRSRASAEIESEMEQAREMLIRQRKSFEDIDRTINQIRGNEERDGEPGNSDGMLF